MGSSSLINNTEIRCINCFNIFTIKINPEFPQSSIIKTCECSTTKNEINTFLAEYKKNKQFKITCSKCNKANQKEFFYCNNCKQIFCSKCLKSSHEVEEFKNHKYISIDKYDFFCIVHQNENYCAYCKNCKIDICEKCLNEKLHENHKISVFKKIYDEKKMKEYLKIAIKGAEDKMNYNKIICKMICKKLNKNEIKDLKNLNEINEAENKSILEVLNIFHEMYNNIKHKNHALIWNMIDNIDFNLEKIKFDKNTTKDADKEALINYFKTDFILKIKLKKEENKNNEENKDKEKNNNENENNDVKSKEINTEEKKLIESEKEEKKEEKTNENNKEDDDGHEKTMKEKQELLKKRFNSYGALNQNKSAKILSNQSNDIINEPKGNPENVINIIQNQTINKKVKKKPRKINFEN